MDWTQEVTLKFIDLYREAEILWDSKNPHYYYKIKKHDAWEKIANELGTSSDECKKKSSNLLASLRREKMKMKKSLGTGRGRDEVYVSSWFAFNHLKFLWDRDAVRETKSTDTAEEDSMENNTERVESELIAESVGETLARTEQQVLPGPSGETVKRDASSQNLFERKKKRKSVYNERLNYAYEILQNAPKSQAAQSESQIFGNLVASKLEKYCADVQVAVQEEIMKIIFKAERGYYNKSQPLNTDPGFQANATFSSYMQGNVPLQSNLNSMHNNYQHQLHNIQCQNISVQPISSASPFHESISSQSTPTPLQSPHDYTSNNQASSDTRTSLLSEITEATLLTCSSPDNLEVQELFK